VRYGQDANPGACLLLRHLISQACIPEFQVRRPLRTNTVAITGRRRRRQIADEAACRVVAGPRASIGQGIQAQKTPGKARGSCLAARQERLPGH
jgi:hypothetical protein